MFNNLWTRLVDHIQYRVLPFRLAAYSYLKKQKEPKTRIEESEF
jgi:hypothetical protein